MIGEDILPTPTPQPKRADLGTVDFGLNFFSPYGNNNGEGKKGHGKEDPNNTESPHRGTLNNLIFRIHWVVGHGNCFAYRISVDNRLSKPFKQVRIGCYTVINPVAVVNTIIHTVVEKNLNLMNIKQTRIPSGPLRGGNDPLNLRPIRRGQIFDDRVKKNEQKCDPQNHSKISDKQVEFMAHRLILLRQ